MIEFFVRRPVTTIMFIMVFVVMGIVSYFNLALQSTPDVDFPIVSVRATYSGATPLEVETLVVDRIEDAVAEISGIEDIMSYSYDGFGVVTIEFDLESDVNIKFIEVKDKVDSIINDLPAGMDAPIVEKFDPLMQPVVYVMLSGESYSPKDLFEFADKKLKDEFSKISGVAGVDIYGGQERRINVSLDPMLMDRYYTTITNVVDKIAAKNRNVPGGLIEKDLTNFNVRFLGEFQNIDEIREMELTSRDGNKFQLKDIATVEDGAKDISTMARFNGRDGVSLMIKKVSDANSVDISRDIHKRFDKIKALLPEGMELEIATDNTTFVLNETKEAQFNILFGILLTVIALYFFTGRPKITLIGSIIIPTSVISTCFLMDMSGFSFNVMTLLALAVSLGTLIANAIVIIESVLMHLERGKSAEQAAIDGTKEVTPAIIASAATNLVVFTPIAFMGGIIGKFFFSFGMTVVFATIFSIIASFTLTPMMCAKLMEDHKAQEKKKSKKKGMDLSKYNPFHWAHIFTHKAFDFIEHEYEKFYKVMFRFPVITLVIVGVLFSSLYFIMPYIGGEFYPSSDQDQIMAVVNMPQGTRIEKTLHVVKRIERALDQVPEVVSYFSYLGDKGEENALVVVDLTPSQKRTRTDNDIIDSIIPEVAIIPDAEITLIRAGGIGDPSAGDVTIDIYGEDYEQIIELAKQAKDKMLATGYFRAVNSSYKFPKKEIRFIPDQNALISFGVDNGDVSRTLRSAIYGDDSNVYKEKGEEYDINIELSNEYKKDKSDVEYVSVIGRKGLLPVTDLGQLIERRASPQIRHVSRQRVVRVEGFIAKSSLGHLREILPKEFEEISFPEGYGYYFAGDADNQDESFAEIGKAFLLAIVLTYMVLAAIMNSFLYPVVAFLLIVVSYFGVFQALFMFGESINISSMLGMVMLVGLVVNNAILVMDYAIIRMKEGDAIIEAIRQGVVVKFRAIILTTFAVIFGTAPQLSSVMPLKTSMAVVMIGGMAAACVFTFIFVPVAFWYLERLRRFLSGIKS